MNKKTDPVTSSQDFFVEHKTREEILSEISETSELEPIPTAAKKAILSLPPSSTKANFETAVIQLNVQSDSIQYRLLKIFCDEKKATIIDTKALIQRVKNFSDEQLKILELICGGQGFTIKDTWKILPLMKKFGKDRLLALRTFVGLDGVGIGPLNQFFMANFPEGKREEMGDEAYKEELREKMMRPDQVTVFYNICHEIANIKPATAIAVLKKTRQMKQQHTQMINTFLKEKVYFGEKPIDDNNILGLVNLWLSLPELQDTKRFKQLIKKLSRKSDKQKKDFQYLIQSFKKETEKKTSRGNFISRVSNLIN